MEFCKRLLKDVAFQGSLSEVEALQRKHALFESSLEAQIEQVAEVERYAQQLTQTRHYDSDNIKKKTKAIVLRYAVINLDKTA